jgi:hypothetical protein
MEKRRASLSGSRAVLAPLVVNRRYGFDAAGAAGFGATLLAGTVDFAPLALPAAAALPAGGAPVAAAMGAALPAAPATGMSALAHTTLPKRDALWKFPWPRIGDHATPELFFMA